jgi:hypothetical protein
MIQRAAPEWSMPLEVVVVKPSHFQRRVKPLLSG